MDYIWTSNILAITSGFIYGKYLDSDIRAYTWNMVWSKTILDYDLRLFYRVLQVKLYLVFFCWQRHRQLFFARQ